MALVISKGYVPNSFPVRVPLSLTCAIPSFCLSLLMARSNCAIEQRVVVGMSGSGYSHLN